ncbi:hypothetical protein TorRG33x02_346740 [Trema orientale]|uniref:Uncharacterized protein n=1 Tax=Trema orientale TaxID=63057 RepID=A0A2P5AMI5_TREOI|nr:hypothetical protein TorRG33x02_346740 [Trema orientale]
MKGSSASGLGSRVLLSSLMVNAKKDENNNRSVKDHEDLTLFREMNNRNRDKDGVISLLHPLSDEFDHSLIPLPSNPNAGTGSDQLYRIPSSKKGSISALDFLAENDKNDYDCYINCKVENAACNSSLSFYRNGSYSYKRPPIHHPFSKGDSDSPPSFQGIST